MYAATWIKLEDMMLSETSQSQKDTRCVNPSYEVPQFSSVQSLSRVQLFATPWTTARQASLSITNSQNSLKLICTELVMPHPTTLSSVIPFSSCLQSFPASGSFQMSQLFASGGLSIGVSASASVSSEHPGLISFRMDWLDLL